MTKGDRQYKNMVCCVVIRKRKQSRVHGEWGWDGSTLDRAARECRRSPEPTHFLSHSQDSGVTVEIVVRKLTICDPCVMSYKVDVGGIYFWPRLRYSKDCELRASLGNILMYTHQSEEERVPFLTTWVQSLERTTYWNRRLVPKSASWPPCTPCTVPTCSWWINRWITELM